MRVTSRRRAAARADTSRANQGASPSMPMSPAAYPSTVRNGAPRVRQPSQDLQPDRQIVWREDPDSVHIVCVPPADPRRAQADDATELVCSSDLAKKLDAGVVAPLVHHEDQVWCGRRQSVGVGRVIGEGLLDKDRNAAIHRLVDNRRMCRDRRRHDDSFDLRQLTHRPNDACSPTFDRGGCTALRTGDDRHLALQGDEVAEDELPPVPAADKANRSSSGHEGNDRRHTGGR